MNSYFSYLHLGEKVKASNHVVVFYRLTTEENFEKVAGGVAAESSVGTWTKVTTSLKLIWDKLHARVLEADKKTGVLKIAYPLALFEKGNLAQLLSSVAGNVFGLKEVKYLKLLDLELPEKYIKSFPGPAVGLEGIRRATKVEKSPLLGSIIKPKLGLNTKQHVKVALEIFKAGMNLVKDDENLTDQEFNRFGERVKRMTDGLKSNIKSWQTKIYAFNVTAEEKIMQKRTELVKKCGGNCIMIDFVTVGFAALQSIRSKNYNLIIHGHRAMHAALTKLYHHGISMFVLAKLARLAGTDTLHTGTVVGKMGGEEEEVKKVNNFLISEWFGLKKVMPVASGGLHPGLIPDLIKILGKDVILNFGGGIHGHTLGSKAGALAVIQALEAVQRKISLKNYAQDKKELKTALLLWSS